MCTSFSHSKPNSNSNTGLLSFDKPLPRRMSTLLHDVSTDSSLLQVIYTAGSSSLTLSLNFEVSFVSKKFSSVKLKQFLKTDSNLDILLVFTSYKYFLRLWRHFVLQNYKTEKRGWWPSMEVWFRLILSHPPSTCARALIEYERVISEFMLLQSRLNICCS